MYLKQLKLRDWKAYTHQEITFPDPASGKNVVLIGANNGFGKTSILEALLVGIFGKDAHPFLARAHTNSMGLSGKDAPNISWTTFLERAFNARASEEGRSSMSIEVVLEDMLGPVVIQRIWHFSGSRRYKPGDDEVRIWLGEERELLRVPRLEEDPEDHYRGIIVQHFLPAQLAQFFLFDGEQVQELARQQAKDQIKKGLDGLGSRVSSRLSRKTRPYGAD